MNRCSRRIPGDVLQHLGIPAAVGEVAQTQAVLPPGEVIFRQRHQRVVRGDPQPAEGVELAFRRALVAIEQQLPRIPLLFQHRLALVNGVFAARLIDLTIAIAIFTVRRGDFALGDAIDDLLQHPILQAALGLHHRFAVGILLAQILQNRRLRAVVIT